MFAGFQVTVNDAVGMGVVDRPTDLNDELNTTAHGQGVPDARLGERQALDKLHDHARATVERGALGEDRCDSGMGEPSHDLAFEPEAPSEAR